MNAASKLLLFLILPAALQAQVGVRGKTGAPPDAKTLDRLEITRPGTY